MIKVTMEELIAFSNNASFFNSENLPLKGAYKLAKINQRIDIEMESYRVKFQEILDKYAQKDEEGNFKFSDDGSQILIMDGMMDECEQAINDLQSIEVEIDNYGLKIEDFGENIECTPEVLEALLPFME